MAGDKAKDTAPEVSAETLTGPQHAWGGIALGLAASALMLVATLWVIGQYLQHRPIDLAAPTHNVGKVAEDVLKHLGASPDLIEVIEPQLERSPRAHFYRTSVTAHLPGTVNPNAAVDALERAMLHDRIVISGEDVGDSERIAYLSLDGNQIAEIRLVHAPSRSASPHIDPHDSGHGASVAHEEHSTPSPDTHAAPANDEAHTPVHELDGTPALESETEHEHQSKAPAASMSMQGMVIPSGMYAPSFGAIAAHGRAKVAQAHPRVAIIVDDGGYGGEATEIMLNLDPGLTFAILPNTPHGTVLAEEAAVRGFEIMLHMPMDNDSETLTHPGQIDIHMDSAKIHELTQSALAQVPGAVGINNHTGSKFTANADAMRRFMEGIQGAGLYFIDSRTTPNTVASEIAREFRIPAAARTLFLDHDNGEAEIRARFVELMQDARAQGSAIGICHFRPNTAVVLRDMLPQLKAEGIELVHASELVR